MKTENKQYKLKRWYPSLDSCWEVGDIAYYYRNGVYWNGTRVVENGVSAKEVENNPDFWELIKEEKPKPLFITEDGVECFDRDGIVWNVRNNNFDKIKIHSIHLNDYDFEHKVFFYESNADEYIWRNKPLFSYEDFIRWGNVPYQRIIEQFAKERSKE